MNYDNLLLRRLDSMLLREGKLAKNVITGATDTILFRRSDSTDEQEQITLYYHNDDFLSKGNIISYNGANYLAINKNHWESDVHFKSNCIKCNQVWYLPEVTIPVLVEELQQPQPDIGTVVTSVDGFLQVRTSDVPYFHTGFPIDTKINVCGGQYYLVNKFFLDGVCYLYFVREAAEVTLSPEIYCDYAAAYAPGDVIALHPYITMTYSDTIVYVPAAAFMFESNDDTLALCEDNNVYLLDEGQPIITITGTGTFESGGTYYTDITLLKEITLNIDSAVSDVTMSLACASDLTIKINGSYKTLTASFTDANGDDVTADTIADLTADDFVWAFTVDGEDVSDIITTTGGDTINVIKVKFIGDRSYSTKTFLTTCTCGDLVATLEMTIAQL